MSKLQNIKPDYISLNEAAQSTGYSSNYLRLRAGQKKLKAVKVGRDWFTTKKWLQQYLEINSNAISVSNKAKVSLVQGIGVWEDIVYYLNSDMQHLQAFTSSFGSGGLNPCHCSIYCLKKLSTV